MRLLLALALGTALVTAGCTFSQGATRDGAGQEASASGREFYHAVQGMKSGTQSFPWTNEKREATYDVAIQGTGAVRITIKDAAGKTMLDREISVMGQQGKSGIAGSGEPGAWTITLAFKDLNGQGAIRVAPR